MQPRRRREESLENRDGNSRRITADHSGSPSRSKDAPTKTAPRKLFEAARDRDGYRDSPTTSLVSSLLRIVFYRGYLSLDDRFYKVQNFVRRKVQAQTPKLF